MEGKRRAYVITWRGDPDSAGVYWTGTAEEAKATAWRHYSDVFDTREYRFIDFVQELDMRRAYEFDGCYRGRQAIRPECVEDHAGVAP